MARGLAAAHQRGSSPFTSQWQAIFQLPWQLLSRLPMLQGREFRRGTKGGAGAISNAIAVGGLFLILAGCGGGSSNVPEVGGQAPAARHAPVAQDLTMTTNEDTPVVLNVLADDRDADGDLLSVVSLVQPRHGTVRMNPDNTITYTPDARFNGTDTFAYTIGDGRDCTDSGTLSALIRGNRLLLPNIGAGPEPPVQFTVNVQALVHVVDTTGLVEQMALHVNLNHDIKIEVQPVNPTASLGRLFANDLVAIDANAAGTAFLVVSRGGNDVMRASADANGRITLGSPNVVRFQTGNLPNGVVISKDVRRAYANNEANVSVTVIDLVTNTVLTRDIPAGEPSAPGTLAHAVLLGNLAFFTALGIPDHGIFGTPIRDIVPLASRGKASNNAWSSCASCHPDGLSDGVTWIFPAGPRQTLPLDALFAKDNPDDQKIVLWSAARGSNTDFNTNARNVQGGCGFASDAFASPGTCTTLGATTPANPNIYDHGITQGASDALDALTLWVQTVRTLLRPPPSDAAAFGRGQMIFGSTCAPCHGGQKWTKSEIFYRDNPAFTQDPAAGGVPLDPGVTNAGAQIVSFTLSGLTITDLEDVGTFDAADPLEIRGAGAASGQ